MKFCFAVAVGCFACAAYIDSPFDGWPQDVDKRHGNFACSLGWLFLTIALSLGYR